MDLRNLSEDDKKMLYHADPFHMTKSIMKKEIRGLERISIQSIQNMNLLSKEVVNILLVYFYREFSEEVYNRNDLKKLYNIWAVKGVSTVEDAILMTDKDIRAILGYQQRQGID
ncbi:DnaD domain protein [Rossellomorea aquimaris]|uniref:DnaD domain protein n=1 Tax=Rossellomorea aquimaris TaxID=189382 RepID=UPI001CD319F6|nr:DnaD domain protein [Rossellomorea aquimaris]MCA1054421.1 DnaD domain protein [Rossellomorea aquimaris]